MRREIVNQIQIPNKPYVTFPHDGTRYLQDTVGQAEAKFAEDEVGEPLIETVDLYLNDPNLFRTYGRDAAGSRTWDGGIPCLREVNGYPGVGEDSLDNTEEDWGAGSRGRKIIALGS